MKYFTVLCLCVASALSAPSGELISGPKAELSTEQKIVSDETAKIRALPALEHEEIHNDLGEFTIRFVTAEGITVITRARLVPTPDGSDRVLVYEGEYSYIGDDGKLYVTKYSSDYKGAHQVQGNHLPKAPEPIPYEAPAEAAMPEPIVAVVKEESPFVIPAGEPEVLVAVDDVPKILFI